MVWVDIIDSELFKICEPLPQSHITKVSIPDGDVLLDHYLFLLQIVQDHESSGFPSRRDMGGFTRSRPGGVKLRTQFFLFVTVSGQGI